MTFVSIIELWSVSALTRSSENREEPEKYSNLNNSDYQPSTLRHDTGAQNGRAHAAIGLTMQAKSDILSQMQTCVEEADLREMGHTIAADFDRRIALIPEDMCLAFHTEARQLETQLLTIYQLVARVTRKVDDLDKVASLWEAVVNLCDEFAGRLGNLVKQHPDCGASSYYDRVLDLRNKCHRLHQMHR
jgi:hypothetical protein